jgi:CDP-diacylglycerol--glycerol-3-phosphate 3-phosphatidyltransferase
MKVIPNAISIARIILSLSLIFIKPLSDKFYIIYIICGISDFLDGFIARKTGTVSGVGARIDSIADMIMIGVVLFLFYPIMNPTAEIIVWIILITMIRVGGMVLALKKYKTFVSIHTYGNKITGLIFFLFPILFMYIDTIILIYIVCIIATISAVEEFVIQLTSKEVQLNRKSIFQFHKK